MQDRFVKMCFPRIFKGVVMMVWLVCFGAQAHAAGVNVPLKTWPQDFSRFHDTIRERYAFTQWKGIDWQALYADTSLDVVTACLADSVPDYYAAVREYLFAIPDGHVSLFPASPQAKSLDALLTSSYLGYGYGLGITHLDDGGLIAYYLTPGGPAEQAGIQPGAQIIQWNGQPAAQAPESVTRLWLNDFASLATSAHQRLVQERLLTRGPENGQATLSFQNPGDNEIRTAVLRAVEDNFDSLNHGSFAAKAAAAEPVVASRLLDSGHGYIRLTREPDVGPDYDATLADFGAALSGFMAQGVQRVVVDLRGNQGGHDVLAADLSGFFHSEPAFYETATQYNPATGAFEAIATVTITPRSPHFDGPVIALVNPATVSSGEGVAMGIQKAPNGMVMGFHGTNGSFGMILPEYGSEDPQTGSVIPFSIDDNQFLAVIPTGQSLDAAGQVQLDSQNHVGGITVDLQVPRTRDNLVRFARGEDVELAAATWPAGTGFQTILDNAVGENGVPGAIMAVSGPDGAWVGAAGKADLDTGRAMTVNTEVRIASITKVFTATLAMKLVEEGLLSLDQTVDHWLPDILPQNSDQITLAMLLNHTSGMPEHEDQDEYYAQLLTDPYFQWSSQDVLDILARHQDEFQTPGQAYHYCNTGYYILGMIIEKATGSTVEEQINTRFFNPLGMDHTRLTRDGFKTAPYARDYTWLNNTLTDTSGWSLSWDWTAGSGVTTAPDMLRWTRALFSGNAVSQATLDQMTTPVLPAREYGYGLTVKDSEFFGRRYIGHGGGNFGVHTSWFYFPDSGHTLFIALNRLDAAPPIQMDATAVMQSMLQGVRDILWPE